MSELLPEPQAVAAEQAVLGTCLAYGQSEAPLEVTRALRPEDFHHPANQAVYIAVAALVDAREPVDPVAVWHRVEAAGNTRAVPDGLLYLHELIANAPVPTAVGHHVRLVKDTAARRAIARIAAMSQQAAATPAGGTPTELLETIRSGLDQVAGRYVATGVKPIKEILDDTLAEIEALASGNAVVGIPTGFPDLDRLLHGLRPGQMIMVAGRPGQGKALALDTPILTTTGWTTMADLAPGMAVYGVAGQPTTVVAATEVLVDRPCYQVRFTDGTVITADAEHEWTVADLDRRPVTRTVTTRALHDSLHGTPGHPARSGNPLRYAVPPVAAGPHGPARPARNIAAVTPVPSVPVRCIQVDAPDALYLAGPTLVPTHNSTLMMDIVRNAVFHHGKQAMVFSLEMSKEELMKRIISAQARVELEALLTKPSQDDWDRISRAYNAIGDSHLALIDDPNYNMTDIRALARMHKDQHGLDLIAIDYLQLMTPAKRLDSRQQEVSEISRQTKLLAKELGVPVIALSQLNRGSEQRADKRPQLADLRDSGGLEQDSDVVMLVHRDEVYNPEQRVGEADIIVAKHRGGPTGTVPVIAQLHYSRFMPAAFPG